LDDLNFHFSETLIDPDVEQEIEGMLEDFKCNKIIYNKNEIFSNKIKKFTLMKYSEDKTEKERKNPYGKKVDKEPIIYI